MYQVLKGNSLVVKISTFLCLTESLLITVFNAELGTSCLTLICKMFPLISLRLVD